MKSLKFKNFLKFVFVKINVCENKINLYLRNSYIRYPHPDVNKMLKNCEHLRLYTNHNITCGLFKEFSTEL